MTYRTHLSPAIAMTFAALLVLAAPAALAKEAAKPSWIKDEISVDGSAQIYLNAAFAPIKGKFKAVPESITDRKDSIEGSFLLGEYRYMFKKPETGTDGKVSDELVSTEVLDCKNNYFGTMKQVRKYKGKVVSEKSTPASDVTMMQSTLPNIGAKLCAVSQGKNVSRLAPRANPSYNPRPTQQDIDRTMDKYGAPEAKKSK